MKKITLIAFFAIILFSSKGQNFVWTKTFGNTADESAEAITTDLSANVITVGTFSGTVDFDPSGSVANLTATGTSQDIYISKLNSAGAYVWAKKIGNASGERINDVVTDASGNIYITGAYIGTVDFDPSATTVNLVSNASSSDIFIAKYNSLGALVWAKSLGGANFDEGQRLDIDASNNLYVAGTFTGTADFDPSALTKTLTVFGGSNDVFVGKYDASGNYLWAWSIGGTGYESATGIKCNSALGFLAVTGTFNGNSTDISPNYSGVNVNTAGNTDIFITRMATSDGSSSLTNGSIGGTGYEVSGDLEIDASGNIIIGGNFSSASDFDLSATPLLLYPTGATGSTDGFVLKLDQYLTTIFVKQFKHSGSFTAHVYTNTLKLDAINNIYIGGYLNGVTDFDPSSTTTYTLTTSDWYDYDCFITKLNSVGDFVWAKKWGMLDLSANSEAVNCLSLDLAGNVYSCGTFGGNNGPNCDFDPGVGTFTVVPSGTLDAFVHKLSCTLPSTVTTVTNLVPVCIGSASSKTIAVSSSPEAGVSYNWSALGASGVVFSPSTGTTTGVSFTGTTNFSVVLTASNTCGTTTMVAASVSINPLPILTTTISPSSICTGDAATFTAGGATTYTWSPSYIINGISTIHFAGGVFTVTATNSNNCVNTKTVSFVVNPLPTIGVSGKTTVCLNKPNILTATGATTYTWLPSSLTTNTIISTPTVNTTYSVTGIDINGCKNTGTISISLVTPQTPSICMVTVDSLSNYNEIYWQRLGYTNVDSFIVYREVSSGIYKRIGGKSKSDLGLYIDTNRTIGPANGNPNLTSYKYRIQLKDTCGNLSAMSAWHSTIFVQDQLNGNFNWNSYAIEGTTVTPVSNYNLKRYNVATGASTLIVSTTGNLATDPNYLTDYSLGIKWYVDAYGFGCDPALRLASPLAVKNKTKSNSANEKAFPSTIGLNEINDLLTQFNLYPNPTNEFVIVDFKLSLILPQSIEICNSLGQIVYESKNIQVENIVNLSSFLKGIYFVSIKSHGGKIGLKKLIIQ